LKTPATDDRSTVLLDILREVLNPDTGVEMDTDLFESGLDSMAIMQLLIAIETRMGKAIPVSDVTRENFHSPREILSLLQA